jgi:hypothetical protein
VLLDPNLHVLSVLIRHLGTAVSEFGQRNCTAA